MRRLWTSLLTLCLVAVSMTVGVSAASAATPVTIGKIASTTAAYGSKVTVKPKVTHAKSAKVVSAKMTVKKGGSTVAKNKASVKLAAGTYKVTTTAKYKTFRTVKKTTTSTKNVVTVTPDDETRVTCTASRVTLPADGGLELDGSCTGAAFDGTVTIRNFEAYDENPWWGFDDNFTGLEFTSTPTVGKAFSAYLNPSKDLYKKKQVTTTTSTKVWSAVQTKTKTQTLVIKAGKKPNHAAPYSDGECPSWAPVKGNANSGIYHVPGGRYYSITIAEECFTTPGAARAHGYRASRNG
ncbi:sunset domain-containing protein [Cellulomonas rhizosphaerae]|uniref:Bacterial Ig domain-containing protein n=1 Tax=Cellulomonas rhizosphaerae TaxID=2293719 RepID=A0A413RRN3_9CELL|nr:hypothetical protein [Cellulomonas rhizosphaerae]RHA44614.1 hypothetical protein D1825_00310 [Cellulomonas rhizosphaerae]